MEKPDGEGLALTQRMAENHRTSHGPVLVWLRHLVTEERPVPRVSFGQRGLLEVYDRAQQEPLKCLRCGTAMVDQGQMNLHEGLFITSRPLFGVHSCPSCGKVEFFKHDW